MNPESPFAIVPIHESRGPMCREILEELPAWFGIPESIEEYVAYAEDANILGAVADGYVGGFVFLRNATEAACDIHLMAIRPALHRRGLGRALVDASREWARAHGRRYLTVRTIGPSRPDEAYARTRAFYRAVGFEPIEEFLGLWDGNPCLLMLRPV